MPAPRTLPAGVTVLLVEDDYYQAEDARVALMDAGARVLGPCSGEAEALRVMGDVPPSCAVLDINLGEGPEFALARALMSQGAAVVFVTGYEVTVLPADFSPSAVLRKPAPAEALVKAVADAIGGAAQT